MGEYYGISTPASDFLAHYGVKGMKWGVRKAIKESFKKKLAGNKRNISVSVDKPQITVNKTVVKNKTKNIYKNKNNQKKPSSKDVLFVSGSSKTEDKTSPYYRRKLPKNVRKAIKASMKNNDLIIVGDAPGIDRQTQNYLNKKKYPNVEVYGPGKKVRYSANQRWKTHAVDAPEYEPNSPEWLAKKDKAMTDRATKAIAVILNDGSKATVNNVIRLANQHKGSKTYIHELHPTEKRTLIKGLQHPADQQVIGPWSSDAGKTWHYSGLKHKPNKRLRNAQIQWR
jgi:hypothetical protein